MSLNIDAWNVDQPRRLRVGDVLVRLGWFHTLDPSTITLARGGAERLMILVIAPDSDPSTGTALLDRLAASAAWPNSALEALDSAPAGVKQAP